MKLEIKAVPIGGLSGHDVAEAQRMLADEGWKIIGQPFEKYGRYYVLVERSK